MLGSSGVPAERQSVAVPLPAAGLVTNVVIWTGFHRVLKAIGIRRILAVPDLPSQDVKVSVFPRSRLDESDLCAQVQSPLPVLLSHEITGDVVTAPPIALTL